MTTSSLAYTYLRYNALLPRFVLAHHGVALAGAGLTVGEDADVVALEGVLQHLDAHVLVHASLARVLRVIRLKRIHTS